MTRSTAFRRVAARRPARTHACAQAAAASWQARARRRPGSAGRIDEGAGYEDTAPPLSAPLDRACSSKAPRLLCWRSGSVGLNMRPELHIGARMETCITSWSRTCEDHLGPCAQVV